MHVVLAQLGPKVLQIFDRTCELVVVESRPPEFVKKTMSGRLPLKSRSDDMGN